MGEILENMKNIVGLIAVRTDSSRLKNKAFRQIHGKAIIDILIDRLIETPYLDSFIICTTTNSLDNIIEQLCTKRGVRCFRGDEKDILLRFINASKMIPSYYVARITGDNPLSDFEQMHKCYHFSKENNLDYSRPSGVPLGTAVEVIKTSALKEMHEKALTPELSEYMTYFFELAPFIKSKLYEVEESVKMPDLRLTVDYEEDLVFLNQLIDHFNKIPSLKEIVTYCKTIKNYPNTEFHADNEKMKNIKNAIKFKEN